MPAPRAARQTSRPHGYPSARDTDRFYDQRGEYGPFRECHDTADVVFFMRHQTTGVEAKIYQGGVYRMRDRSFLEENNISLVVNCTSNIDSPNWLGEPGMPHWVRFEVSGNVMRAHALALACSGVCVHVRDSGFAVCGRVFACLCVRVFACSAAPAASQCVVGCVCACVCVRQRLCSLN